MPADDLPDDLPAVQPAAGPTAAELPAARPPDAAVAPPGPLPAGERIVAIDAIRGLAVLGILVMNIVEFGQPLGAYENPAYAGGADGPDRWAWYLQVTLFDGKMRALFSLLFGAGLWLIGERLLQKGVAAGDLLLRRCLWLVPLGIAHRFLLQWTGDILYAYGLLGALAVAFRTLRPRTLLLLGLLALTAFVPIGLRKYAEARAQRDAAAQAAALEADGREVPPELKQARQRWQRRAASIPPPAAEVEGEVAAMRGGWLDVARYRWNYHHMFQADYVYYYFVWDVLGMMLCGMALMQLGFFSGRWSTRAYALVVAVGVAAAASTAVWARAWAETGFSPQAIGLRAIHDTTYAYSRGLAGLGWAAALLLLLRARVAPWLGTGLGAVGRMAFSNYVLQTVVCTLLFFGYGLGLYAELPRHRLLLLVLAISALQLGFSMLWLRWFRFGPLEWLWRSLTWGRLQPLRRAPAAAAMEAVRL